MSDVVSPLAHTLLRGSPREFSAASVTRPIRARKVLMTKMSAHECESLGARIKRGTLTRTHYKPSDVCGRARAPQETLTRIRGKCAFKTVGVEHLFCRASTRSPPGPPRKLSVARLVDVGWMDRPASSTELDLAGDDSRLPVLGLQLDRL